MALGAISAIEERGMTGKISVIRSTLPRTRRAIRKENAWLCQPGSHYTLGKLGVEKGIRIPQGGSEATNFI